MINQEIQGKGRAALHKLPSCRRSCQRRHRPALIHAAQAWARTGHAARMRADRHDKPTPAQADAPALLWQKQKRCPQAAFQNCKKLY